jgi:hypothetical protein
MRAQFDPSAGPKYDPEEKTYNRTLQGAPSSLQKKDAAPSESVLSQAKKMFDSANIILNGLSQVILTEKNKYLPQIELTLPGNHSVVALCGAGLSLALPRVFSHAQQTFVTTSICLVGALALAKHAEDVKKIGLCTVAAIAVPIVFSPFR